MRRRTGVDWGEEDRTGQCTPRREQKRRAALLRINVSSDNHLKVWGKMLYELL